MDSAYMRLAGQAVGLNTPSASTLATTLLEAVDDEAKGAKALALQSQEV